MIEFEDLADSNSMVMKISRRITDPDGKLDIMESGEAILNILKEVARDGQCFQ